MQESPSPIKMAFKRVRDEVVRSLDYSNASIVGLEKNLAKEKELNATIQVELEIYDRLGKELGLE